MSSEALSTSLSLTHTLRAYARLERKHYELKYEYDRERIGLLERVAELEAEAGGRSGPVLVDRHLRPVPRVPPSRWAAFGEVELQEIWDGLTMDNGLRYVCVRADEPICTLVLEIAAEADRRGFWLPERHKVLDVPPRPS